MSGRFRWRMERETHSSTFAWKIPWTEELGELHSKGLQRVRHDWATQHNPIYIDAQLSCDVYSKWLGGDSVSKIKYPRSFRKTLWGIFHHWALSQAQLFLSSRIKAGQCLPLLWSFPGESESNCNRGMKKKKNEAEFCPKAQMETHKIEINKCLKKWQPSEMLHQLHSLLALLSIKMSLHLLI